MKNLSNGLTYNPNINYEQKVGGYTYHGITNITYELNKSGRSGTFSFNSKEAPTPQKKVTYKNYGIKHMEGFIDTLTYHIIGELFL